jgi:hypothetical protein
LIAVSTDDAPLRSYPYHVPSTAPAVIVRPPSTKAAKKIFLRPPTAFAQGYCLPVSDKEQAIFLFIKKGQVGLLRLTYPLKVSYSVY